MERSVPLRAEIIAGLLAGVAGGIAIEAFYYLTMLPGGTAVLRLLGSFAFVSSVLLGLRAYANPVVAVPLGIVLHFCVSVGWALGYVYLTRTQRQLIEHPWISGAAFGLVVYVFMQLVLLTAGVYHRPSSPEELTIQLVAHIVFYGIPVALVASRALRRTASGPAV